MKFVIFWGTHYSYNRGVNALTISLINLIRDNYPKSEITLYGSGESEEKIIDKKLKFIPLSLKEIFSKNYRNTLLSEIKSSDFILDLSEGDSFTDIYGRKRMLIQSFFKFVECRYNSLYLMPQTIGPFKSNISKSLAKQIIYKSKKVYSRDNLSSKYVHKLCKIESPVYPDLAFYLKPNKPPGYEDIFNKSKKCIGLNINGLLWNKGYNKKNQFNFKIPYKKLIDFILMKLSEYDLQIYIIPHTYNSERPILLEDDLSASKEIYNSNINADNINIIDKNFTAEEIKWIISKMDFFIGSRMHSCIASMSQGIPTIAIAYSRKFQGLFSSIDLGNLVIDPISEDSKENILNKILSSYTERDYHKKVLNTKMKNIKMNLKKMIEDVVENE